MVLPGFVQLHLLEMQLPEGHTTPHRPQLFASNGPVQTPLQQTLPPGDDPHAWSHWPQLLTSLDVFLHVPPQQSSLLAQAWPHAPQCITLLRVSTHVLLHTVFPAGQTHTPPAQLPPAGQALPQVPQFWFVPSGVEQVPLEQHVPCEQQATLSESSEAQIFCVFPPHCLQALLQFDRCRVGRVLQ